MPFDQKLAMRLAEVMAERPGMVENRMMGGFGYLLYGNMCVGIHKDTLLIRVGTDVAEEILKRPHVRPMDLTGRVMRGWATIEPGAILDRDSLEEYCELAIAFVSTLPKKSSRRKIPL